MLKNAWLYFLYLIYLYCQRKGSDKMTPQKRREARAKQEALQKARKDQRLGLTKQSQKKSKKR